MTQDRSLWPPEPMTLLMAPKTFTFGSWTLPLTTGKTPGAYFQRFEVPEMVAPKSPSRDLVDALREGTLFVSNLIVDDLQYLMLGVPLSVLLQFGPTHVTRVRKTLRVRIENRGEKELAFSFWPRIRLPGVT